MTGFFAISSIVFGNHGGAAQIWTGEWRFCRPLPYHLATAPMKNPVFSMLSRFFCGSIIAQNCSGTKVCFVQTFVPKSLFQQSVLGGISNFYNKLKKSPPLIILSITIRIACNMRVWHHAKKQAQYTIVALRNCSFLAAYKPACRDSGIVFQY